jgi:hypothetical protein
MAEEKKEEIKEIPKAEAPKPEAPKAEVPKAEAPKSAADAKPAEVAKVEEKKKEKPANCAVCNKSIRKKRYYYRNGKFFCTKRCWKTTIKKEETTAEKETPSDAKDQTPSAS